MNEKLNELKKLLGVVSDLRNAEAVLSWDQQTYMPPKGAGARAMQMATLGRLAHEHFISDEVGKLIEQAADETAALAYDSDDASLVRVTRRDYDKARRVPAAFVEELTRTASIGLEAWTKARKESNFKIFQSHLEKIVELEIQLANYLGYTERIYDALLDEYEPGMKTREVEQIFAPLKTDLAALAHAIAQKKDAVNAACLRRDYDEQAQWNFGIQVIGQIGFDFQSGRQDKSAHPFTTGFGVGDTRITTRVDKNFIPSMLFGTIHETGHALYDMGYNPAYDRSPLAGGASLGVHESQSRLWENLVGRSRGFWKYWFPRLREVFPAPLADQDLESFYRAINQVAPSFIRVEADEVTYSLHIMLRLEMENMLIERKIKVVDVPDVWNAKMKDYLGITPPNDARGCLHDIHGSYGSIGYFATYSLGSMFAVQLYEKALQDIPAIPAQIEQGQYAELLGWLRKNVHIHGRKFTLDELAQKVTGESLQSKSYVAYLKKKFGEIYGV